MIIWNWIINLWTLFMDFCGKNQEATQSKRIIFAFVYKEQRINQCATSASEKA